jgi:hypothetical protein
MVTNEGWREELKMNNVKEIWIRKERKNMNKKGKIRRHCRPNFYPHVKENYIGGGIWHLWKNSEMQVKFWSGYPKRRCLIFFYISKKLDG